MKYRTGSFLTIVLAGFCIAEAQAVDTNLISTASWWNSIRYDGTNPILPTHDSFAAAGSYGGATPTGWAGSRPRGIYLFNTPAIIRDDFPGYGVVSATLTLNLGFFDQGPGHIGFIGGAPGVKAYHVEIGDHTLGGVISSNDYFATELRDMGMIVPPTTNVPAAVDYSIDITTALRTAVLNPQWGEMFAVRLQFGNEALMPGDPLGIDENLYFAYFFEWNLLSGRNPRIEYTLTTDETTVAFSQVSVTNTLALLFQSQSNINYQVQSSTNMPSEVWTNLDYILLGTGGQMLAFDPAGITTGKTYRIVER